MKYQILFYQKNNEKIFKTVVWCLEGKPFQEQRENTMLFGVQLMLRWVYNYSKLSVITITV